MCYSLGARLPWALSFAFYHGKGQLTMNNEELAQAIKTGERDKLLPLWDQVRRFAYQQARRWAAAGRGGITVEDLQQESFLALLDALERWRPDAGPFLPMYALRLKAAFTAATGQRTQRDRLDPLQGCISLDAPLTDSEGDPLYLGDVLPDQRAEAAVEAVVERDAAALRNEAIRQALNALPADQRRVIVLKYWHCQQVENKTHQAALRALRRPAVSRRLRQYMTPV